MASKKKRNRPRPPAAPRAAKPVGAKPQTDGPAAAGPPVLKPSSARPAGDKQAVAKPAGSARQAAGKGPTRAERLAAAEKARRRKALRTRVIVIGVLVSIVALITVTVISSRRSNQRVVSRLEASGACEYDTRTDPDQGQGRNHLSGDVPYTVDPPAGGNHNPSAARSGIFTMETKPPDPQIVHALEHGYVTIWHRPDIAPDALEELKSLAGRYDRDVLLVPRESLTQPVAATAWHRRLLCTRPDVESLERFVTSYRNKGPEKVPH